MPNRFEKEPQSIGKEDKVRSLPRRLMDVPLTMGLLVREALLHPLRGAELIRGTKTNSPRIVPIKEDK